MSRSSAAAAPAPPPAPEGVRFLRTAPRLPVADLRRTVDFYTSLLGFESGDPWPADDPSFVILARDDVTIQFFRGGPVAPAGATISIDVTDATAIHAAVKDKVAIVWGPEVYWYGRREFSFLDPDGYAVIVSEETSDSPTCADD